MGRYRFAVEYEGTRYAGWQIQAGQLTVAAELEKALRIALRAPVRVVGAGRTDAGVHARGQAAHFDCDGAPDAGRLQRSLNALTPGDICVRGLEACGDGFHARYQAVSRRYRYRIVLRPTALYRRMTWECGFPLDADAFDRELAEVEGLRDFANFSVPRKDGKGTECRVLRAELLREGEFLSVNLEADRFLHKMVRSIVGACFDVARRARPAGLVRGILAGDFRGEWTWAPALGLCLEKVVYEDYDY